MLITVYPITSKKSHQFHRLILQQTGHMIPLLRSFRACATLAVGKVCKINANAIEKFVPEKKGEMQQRFPGGAETCSNSWSGNHSLKKIINK